MRSLIIFLAVLCSANGTYCQDSVDKYVKMVTGEKDLKTISHRFKDINWETVLKVEGQVLKSKPEQKITDRLRIFTDLCAKYTIRNSDAGKVVEPGMELRIEITGYKSDPAINPDPLWGKYLNQYKVYSAIAKTHRDWGKMPRDGEQMVNYIIAPDGEVFSDKTLYTTRQVESFMEKADLKRPPKSDEEAGDIGKIYFLLRQKLEETNAERSLDSKLFSKVTAVEKDGHWTIEVFSKFEYKETKGQVKRKLQISKKGSFTESEPEIIKE